MRSTQRYLLLGLAATLTPVGIIAAPVASAECVNAGGATAADLAGVMSGVSAATSAYLFTYPDVNAFFTGLKGQPKDQIPTQVESYLDANPQVRAELQGIRQPSVDFRNCCG
jgi:heme-binding protein